MFEQAEIEPMGERAVIVRLGAGVDELTHRRVRQLAERLEAQPFAGMIEVIPAFDTVTIVYDPLAIYLNARRSAPDQDGELSTPYAIVESRLREVLGRLRDGETPVARLLQIPVCYGGPFGEDLAHVAERNGLSPEEVIAIHAGTEYVVYMLGFAPGFPYLGGMDGRIAAPRRATPRLTIPPGSVGIAGEQTGIYPIGTPGGWQLIGRTPLRLFVSEQDPPTLLRAGDRLRFVPITPEQYAEWEEGARDH
ncbi:hypothetical protein PA598K_03577 [Paenibacillus sp. 598K]|uniref:5-oxoprolinase subunit PxpB n=1 Tax=Paenibacillus sp. 598K TaxID=1117987 RepID=UPI000FFB022F|nr:5-oxoprolinase subunit PxpB [Paenibacillus sp. 598K]GBF75190.1 hypothetical protein PA598K_03577 [Paenibacillus sp. 598K]